MAIQPSLPRRRILQALLAGPATLGLGFGGPLRAAAPSPEARDAIDFEVFRDGDPLGSHRLDFRTEGGRLHVEIAIDLEVRFAFIPVFRYRHRNHEVWRDGRLVAIDTETDDDGERFQLRGRAGADGFRVEGSGGRFLAPAGIMPSSYWNPETVRRRQLLDTQHGRLIDVEIAPAGEQPVRMAGRQVPATRYRMYGELTLDLWYTAAGEWAKIAFDARGARVDYRRRDRQSGAASLQSSASGQ